MIVIHGGAGTITPALMTPEKEAKYHKALKEAVEAGSLILTKGGTALDAAQTAIKVLEDSPLFNAGRGSVYTHDGYQEMDAAIMCGKTLKAGAASLLRHVKNPIELARLILEKSEHVYLTGSGAETFGDVHGLELVENNYFHDDRRYAQLLKAIEQDEIILDHTEDNMNGHANSDNDNPDKKYGTVGAVALDQYGNLAAATSTGGMTNKKYNRIGDSSIIGAGTYANNNTCAVSCTGHGEYFMRGVVAYDLSCLVEYKGLSLQEASNFILNEKLLKLGGRGGMIALDKNGNFIAPFNTKGMYRAWKRNNEKAEIYFYE